MNAYSETTLNNGTLYIASHIRYGGALTSLKMRGFEYINNPIYPPNGKEDHGRQLQSALVFDGMGECLNPTQAGSDPRMSIIDSSLTRSTYVHKDTIYTAAEMGYWFQPGWSVMKGCWLHPELLSAQNTTVRSTVLLQSAYKLGYNGFKNILINDVTFNIHEAHSRVDYEASTIYTPTDFDRALYVTDAGYIQATSRTEQTSPIIMYTVDEQFAIGIKATETGMRYTFSANMDSSKLAAWKRVTTGVKAGEAAKFRVFYIFGTLEEVKATMEGL